MKLKGKMGVGDFGDYKVISIPITEDTHQEAKKWVFSHEIQDGKEITIEVKEKHKKRSLNANAYFWALVNKMAVVLNSTDMDIYKDLVHKYGVCTTLMVTEEAKGAFKIAWESGKDSSGWFVEDLGHGVIRAFQGTSTYNTKQMSRIIDGLVEECKEQGIETMTPDELEHLKNTWRK